MSVRPIVLLGDPRLRLKGKPVDSFGKYLHGLLDDLAHTMRDAPGVGLAAPQLGEAMQACVIEVENQLYELVNPRIVRSDRRRPRSRGLPVDPGLRRLRDPPRAGLGRRPGPPRPEDQGRRLRAARSGAPARARPPRRQALHRLPRVDGRAAGRRRAATRTTRRSARRRAPWRDRPAGPIGVRSGRSSSGAARSPCRSSRRSSRAPDGRARRRRHGARPTGRPARGADRGPTAGRDAPRELGVRRSLHTRRGCATRRRSRTSLALEPELGVLADYGQIVPAALLGLPRTGRSTCTRRCCRATAARRRSRRRSWPAIRATGVTLIRMDEGLDTGPIVAQATWPLDGDETDAGARGASSRAWRADLLADRRWTVARGELAPTPTGRRRTRR